MCRERERGREGGRERVNLRVNCIDSLRVLVQLHKVDPHRIDPHRVGLHRLTGRIGAAAPGLTLNPAQVLP